MPFTLEPEFVTNGYGAVKYIPFCFWAPRDIMQCEGTVVGAQLVLEYVDEVLPLALSQKEHFCKCPTALARSSLSGRKLTSL